MIDLAPYYAIAENCIANLGLNPANCRGAEPGFWSLRKGSATVEIYMWYSEQNGNAYIRICSSVLPIPKTRHAELYEELLRYNLDFIGVTFSISNDSVVLKTDRELSGLDIDELHNMLTRIGNVADEYDNLLQEKY